MDYNLHTGKVNGMELRIFLLADFANLDAGNKLNIIGAFNSISSSKFPTIHPSMHLVAKVAAELGEYGKERPYSIIFYDEDATELGTIKGTFAFPQPKGKQHSSEFNIVLGIRDLPINKSGRYEFRLLVNDHIIGVLPLDVLDASAEEQQE